MTTAGGAYEVDWDALRRAAAAAAEGAYAPYSGLRVGAAALVDDGRTVVGCNVESASYGLTLCAECGVVSNLHASGGGRLVALCCVSPDSERALWPCGRCRQLLHEHGGPSLLIRGLAGGLAGGLADGPMTLDDLLPLAFGAEDLPPGPSTPPP